ncbi:DUF72 domain-containing protein [Mechercharimyces sp. CAU 1602]|uniref:DUF72 domain-containing protein n=1 Tax=Mechercharimyces sp. CAU 1602 TaxID=2973933 RepID=UPI002161475A|nr:DUF72 domain-containing protein [Mechercharimyces sp. CAU 1602]MCS1351835.1 DUF72 domain-containing protein [Mechercharimyces sp. CAU 1602]
MNKVQVGVCGWGDHDVLYTPGTPSHEKLAAYAGHFPVVEVDSSYHAIPTAMRCQHWVEETPPSFQFVVKAYREMTGHGRPKGAPERGMKEIFHVFAEAITPFVDAGRLTALLFQFPPWFDCTREHVQYIRRCRQTYANLPLAIEFRHQSWYTPAFRARTLALLKQENLIHVVCDEPQAGAGCVPLVPVATHPHQALIRFHGRNHAAWNGKGRPDWREVRYAYRYSEEELREWKEHILALQQQAEQVTILFNNNSQGDAAPNAKELIKVLGIKLEGLAARQLSLLE